VAVALNRPGPASDRPPRVRQTGDAHVQLRPWRHSDTVPRMTPREVRRLLKESRQIHGWFLPAAAGLFGLIDQVQQTTGVCGDLFEIGVHHGKSTVFLGRMARKDEAVGVCDIFGGQQANVSGSGAGDRNVFARNMQSIAPATPTHVYEKLSGALTSGEIGGPYRFFHIDGGHLAEEALADLRLAADVLDTRGVIAVDDPFSSAWPGVTEGILAFCAERPEFQTIALGFNKLVLARDSSREMYDLAIASSADLYIDRKIYVRKTLPIAGSPAAIFLTPSDRQMPRLQSTVARVGWFTSGVRRKLKRGD
jgi:Methyltransferase domain